MISQGWLWHSCEQVVESMCRELYKQTVPRHLHAQICIQSLSSSIIFYINYMINYILFVFYYLEGFKSLISFE